MSERDASQRKLTPSNALKTSSVNRVQYRIRPDALTAALHTRSSAVQHPTHEYMGKKGSPRLAQ
jgi:hypothetical protein